MPSLWKSRAPACEFGETQLSPWQWPLSKHSERGTHVNTRKRVWGRGSNKCKGPELRLCLVYLSMWEAHMAGAGWERRRVVKRSEIQEVRRRGMIREGLEAMIRILAFCGGRNGEPLESSEKCWLLEEGCSWVGGRIGRIQGKRGGSPVRTEKAGICTVIPLTMQSFSIVLHNQWHWYLASVFQMSRTVPDTHTHKILFFCLNDWMIVKDKVKFGVLATPLLHIFKTTDQKRTI
jgi:hypothetical protein